jgi:hypothetical protein
MFLLQAEMFGAIVVFVLIIILIIGFVPFFSILIYEYIKLKKPEMQTVFALLLSLFSSLIISAVLIFFIIKILFLLFY